MSRILAAALVVIVAGCAGRASFPNLTPESPLTVTGRIHRPKGPGPFPAVVLLHGCDGIDSGTRRWARWLSERGYLSLIVDSFSPRGFKEVCTFGGPDIERTARFDDAFGALQYLQSLPFVDPRRIAAIGWSHGGVYAIAAINGPSLARARARGVMMPAIGFTASVALYPGGCFSLVDELVVAPLLLLIGGADDWTPQGPCLEMVEKMKRRGAEASITVYPDAYHYFDVPDQPFTTLPDVANRNKPGGCCGATVGYHPEAAADASRRIEAFLARHLK
ncbi:MAG: dienelactone hydrolase family protein [Candidatus Methylomirabilia bacterium]